jgi:hypothetical protein
VQGRQQAGCVKVDGLAALGVHVGEAAMVRGQGESVRSHCKCCTGCAGTLQLLPDAQSLASLVTAWFDVCLRSGC